MQIQRVSEVTEGLYEALGRLVPQLGVHKTPPTRQALQGLVESESSSLLIASEPGVNAPILGMLCLVVYRVPTGLRSVIEDVVVDEGARGQGIGEALVRYALDLAHEAGAEGVALTSNPQRHAANHLYRSMGFQLRQTNPYYYRFR